MLSRPAAGATVARQVVVTEVAASAEGGNAALFAASIIAAYDPAVREQLDAFRAAQTAKVMAQPDPRIGLLPGGHS